MEHFSNVVAAIELRHIGNAPHENAVFGDIRLAEDTHSMVNHEKAFRCSPEIKLATQLRSHVFVLAIMY